MRSACAASSSGCPHSGPPIVRQEDVIGTKLFVGNLSFNVQRDELQSLFSQAGTVVDVFLPTDRATGRPRGFGFVEFADEQSARAATTRFNGYELQGRSLRVNEAEAQRPRRPPDFFDGGPPPAARFPKNKGSRRNLRAKKRSLG